VSAEVRYARTEDGAHLAYQVLGGGSLDVLSVGYGTVISIDARDDEPHVRGFEHRLASFCRFIRFDPRGLGLSDPTDADRPLTVEGWARDAAAVLDAAGSSQAAILASGLAGFTALALAATRPERVSALVLAHCYARLTRDDDYPLGFPRRGIDQFLDSTVDVTADPAVPSGDVAMLSPSLRHDPDYLEWWTRAGKRGASPATARALLSAALTADVRSALPAIEASTLLLHRTDAFPPVGFSAYLAEHIAGARLVELPGVDALPYAGDRDALVEEIEEFLTGYRGSRADRVLATVLFTDIVGSTERVAHLGDHAWAELLDRHDAMVAAEVRRFRGREIKSTGDGVLATFDAPGRAIRCARSIEEAGRDQGIDIRAGIHAGEIELRGDDVSGMAVHIAQRVSALAGAGEVFVSRTVVDLLVGSGIEFDDRGEHALKGVSGPWRIFAVGGPA
jgi:class 3 adenylate cyclase